MADSPVTGPILSHLELRHLAQITGLPYHPMHQLNNEERAKLTEVYLQARQRIAAEHQQRREEEAEKNEEAGKNEEAEEDTPLTLGQKVLLVVGCVLLTPVVAMMIAVADAEANPRRPPPAARATLRGGRGGGVRGGGVGEGSGRPSRL